MDRFAQFAVAAAEMAMKDSGLPIGLDKPHGYDPERVGVIVGSGIGGISALEEQHAKVHGEGPRSHQPLLHHPDDHQHGAGAHLHAPRGQGPELVAGQRLRHQRARHRRGAASRSSTARRTRSSPAAPRPRSPRCRMGGFSVDEGAVARATTSPTSASRPFDKDRDGFVMGEGAGVVVLEELEHAKARGATILAEVVGYGASADAYHITAAGAGGRGRARAACAWRCASAGITPEQVDYINAHGTSTPFNDTTETAGHQGGLRRARPQAGGQLDQVDDRPPARRGRRRRGRRSARWRSRAASCRRPSTTRTRIRTAIWTTCRTRRARCGWTTPSATASASAAPMPSSSSAVTRPESRGPRASEPPGQPCASSWREWIPAFRRPLPPLHLKEDPREAAARL